MKRPGLKTTIILCFSVFLFGLAVGLAGALSDNTLLTAAGIVIMGVSVLMRKLLCRCPHCGASLASARGGVCPMCGKNVYKTS